MSKILLTQEEVAKRWNISMRTLERWRWMKEGPKYIKIGGHVRYRISEIEKYEQERESV